MEMIEIMSIEMFRKCIRVWFCFWQVNLKCLIMQLYSWKMFLKLIN